MRRLIAGLIFFVCGCVASDPNTPVTDEFRREFFSASAARRILAEASLQSMPNDTIKSQIQEKLADRTAILLQEGHGIYVEYTSDDGAVALWYPKNEIIVRGGWRIVTNPYATFVCFTYPRISRECVEAENILGEVNLLDSRPGDPFKLMSGNVPYRKGRNTLPSWPAESDN